MSFSTSAVSTKGQIYEQYFTQSSTLSTEHRFLHEYGTVSLDSKVLEPKFNVKEEVKPVETKPIFEARSKFENALACSSPRVSADPRAQFEQCLKTSTDMKSKFDSSLQSQSMKNDAKSKFETQLKSGNKSNVTASTVGQILQQPAKRHHSAAIKIQVGD